jgi:selenocysteine lyase/cysteine desulfurase
MKTTELTYLDFAATSALRPPAVARAVAAYIDSVGASPGRSAHRLAVAAGRIALECRQSLARVLGLPGDAARIAFMFNATHAINTALHGVLEDGDAVVTTAFDHNAVVRCAQRLAEERNVRVRLVPGRLDGSLDEAAWTAALAGARVVVLNAVSNVLGTSLDLPRLATQAHEAGALVLVDAAQAAGHVPLAFGEHADLVAFSGHKGLLGPQGIGALWARAGIDVRPLLVGGTGGDSMDPRMPGAWPDHLEAGTQNGPGIAGLHAGLQWLDAHGIGTLHRRLRALTQSLHDELSAISAVRVLSPAPAASGSMVTFEAHDLDAARLASRLDREFGVLVRAGLHCAPGVHRMLGTERTGAVRMSLGWSTTEDDVASAVRAVRAIVDAPRLSPAGRT